MLSNCFWNDHDQTSAKSYHTSATSQKKKEVNTKSVATQGRRKDKDQEESASMKLVMTPGPSAEQKKKQQDLSFEEEDALQAKKVAAARSSPEGLLMAQSTNFGETTAPKLAKHVDILKPVMEKMRETYPATFAFMRYQWSRLPPSMRMKMIAQSADYKELYNDPDMKPFTEWMEKLEGSGSVENQLRRVARRAVMAEKMRTAELWQETDAALAELRANEKVIDLMVPDIVHDEDHTAALLDELEENTPENLKDIHEEIQELLDIENNDPELHSVLHYMVEPRESIDPTGNLQRLINPDPLSDVDIMNLTEQRARLNRILLGFKRNVLAEMPEVDRKELLDIHQDAIIAPTDPAEKADWDNRMAVAAQQLEAAHQQGLTSHAAYRESLEEFKADNNTDFVPNPVALRLLLDSMQEVVDDYHPELKQLMEEYQPEQVEELLAERALVDLEERDHRRVNTSMLPWSEDDDLTEHDLRVDLNEVMDEVDPTELNDALHPDYSDLVIKELLEPLLPIKAPIDNDTRTAIMESFDAHLKAYTHRTALDAKYLSEEDKEIDTAFNASPEQALAVVKKVMRLPDTNVRDLSRAVLLDHTRKVMSDLGYSTHDEDMLDYTILEKVQRIRHDLNTQLNAPGATEEDREAATKVFDLLAAVETPIKEGEDYMPVGNPETQFEEAKVMMQATKDMLVEYNAELNHWESRVDSIFSHAREATKRMLDPANAENTPSWVKQLKEMHEKVYGSALPNPLASVTSDDVMAEWSRAVKEQIVFEEARTKVQRERDAVQNAFARQMGPITTVHQPAAPGDVDVGYYPFSSSDIEAERPLEERIYIPQDLELNEIFTESNVGRYITFSDRELKKYLPEGFSLHLTRREFAQTKTKSILLRKQALEAISNLKAQQAAGFVVPAHKAGAANDASIPKPMMLHGHNGCGKSAVLSEVVYWARRSGWLVVYVPDANDYLSSGVYIAKNAQEGTWDQPKLFVRLFGHLISAHSDKLKEIKLSAPVKVGKITAHTLFDVVEYGSVLEQFAAQCFTVFKTEIKKVTQFPVLFAVDAYNALYTPSQAFRDPESGAYHKDPLNPYNMTFGRMLYDAHVDHKLVHGTFIGAVSESVPLRSFVHHKPDPKLHGGAIVQPKYLEVLPYTKSEFTTVMEHYKHTNWVRTQMSSGSASELYIYQLTSGFPGAVWSYAKRL